MNKPTAVLEGAAEMELLHKEIDETALTTGTRKMFHRILDHIEGKAKAVSIQEVQE